MLKSASLLYVLLTAAVTAQAQELKFNEKFSIACHNCFEPQYAQQIEDVFAFTTTIEIDIWDTRKWFGLGGWKAMTKDWYVRHIGTDKGNVNCCGGTFRDCLIRINNWSNQNPTHDVITIFIDKKENWGDSDETRKPNDFDELLSSIFSKEKIFAPTLLLRGKENLKAASVNGNWLTMDLLKGKFIFVITDATEITSRSPLNEYLTSQHDNPICFVAPKINSEAEIQMPKGLSVENSSNVVFYNLQYVNWHLAAKINSINCLSRVYGSPETRDSFNKLVKGKVNFIALDDYKLAK